MQATGTSFLIASFLSLGLPQDGLAQAVTSNPIRYAVQDNNRLFLDGDSERYVTDLNLYLRCSARKDGKYINSDDSDHDCAVYRQRGKASPVEVPDLRTGQAEDEYRVRYDKVRLAHPQSYATDGRRNVRFFLDEQWLRGNARGATGCQWTFITSHGEAEVQSPNCAPVLRDVDLVLSSDGKELSWQAQVRLTLELASSERRVFETKAIVRDYLIVAMGDSFTSGEGNPERNYSSTIPAQWMDYRCNRSVFSYPVIVATALALADPRHSVTLVHVACSGAQTTEGVLGRYDGVINQRQARRLWQYRGLIDHRSPTVPEHWKLYGTQNETGESTLEPQVTQVARLLNIPGSAARKPDLLLMSIGVNDVGFADLLHRLATSNCGNNCFAELRRWRAEEAADCGDNSTAMRIRRSFKCLQKRLANVRDNIHGEIAPQRAYLMEYIDPLRDEKNELCTNEARHKKQLLDGVLGSFGKAAGRVGLIKLTTDEFRFADDEFYAPLQRELANTAAAPGWAVPPSIEAHEKKKRGFCASPSWYHTYQESRNRQNMSPGRLTESTGTLHPNVFGHYYVALRVLTQLRSDNHLAGHNINLMTGSEFDPKVADGKPRADGSDGFAFYLQSKHRANERIENYYKF